MWPPGRRPEQVIDEIINAPPISEFSGSGPGENAKIVEELPPRPTKVVSCQPCRPIDPQSFPSARVRRSDVKRSRSTPPVPRDSKWPRPSGLPAYERYMKGNVVGNDDRPESNQAEEWIDYRCGCSQLKSSQRRELWNRCKTWSVRFGPGSDGSSCKMKLYPLIIHSRYLMEKLEAVICHGDEQHNPEIEISDCPCYPTALKLANAHCAGAIRDRDCSLLSHDEILNLMAVGKFLEMDCLTNRASILLEHKLHSQEDCTNLLQAFRDTDMAEGGEHHATFQNCKNLLLQKMLELSECNLDSMIYIASRLPPDVAERIFQSCRDKQCSLYHNTKLEYEEKDYEFILFSHAASNNPKRIKESYVFKPCPWGCVKIASEVDLRLSSLSDPIRRGKLLLNLSKALIVTRLGKHPDEPYLGTTSVSWDWLCLLLKQTGEWRSTSPTRFGNAPFLGIAQEEISHMQWMVACCLASSANPWLWTVYGSAENAAIWGLQMLQFDNLLAITKLSSRFYPPYKIMSSIAVALDTAVGRKLREGQLSVGEALTIYRSFLNGTRPSHLEIYRVFEPQLQGQAMSVREVIELGGLLSYAKIPSAIVDILASNLCVICKSEEDLLELCSMLDKDDLPTTLEKIVKDLRLAHDMSLKFMSKECVIELSILLESVVLPDNGFQKLFDKLLDKLHEDRCSYALFTTFWNRRIYDPRQREAAREELMKFQIDLGARPQNELTTNTNQRQTNQKPCHATA